MIFRQQLPGYSPISLRTLWPGGGGRNVEDRLAEAFDAEVVWMTDSGTSALTLAIIATGMHRTGPVGLPAYGCYDLATAAEAAGADVLLYDLDPDTLGPDETSFRRALDSGASRVVAVHLFGIPVDLGGIGDACDRSGAVVIEDAAQGVGGTWEGRALGSLGRWSVLSFGRGKGRSAGGGGALLGREGVPGATRSAIDQVLEDGGMGLRELAAWFAQWCLGRPSLYGIPSSIPALRLGETIYHEATAPRRISAWCRHAVPSALDASATESACRRQHTEELLSAVRAAPGLAEVGANAPGTAGYLRLPVRALSGVAADRLRELWRLGVMPAYPKPLTALPRFARRVGNRDAAFPGGYELAARLFTLPTHSRVTRRDLRRLTEAVARIAL